MEDRAAKVYNRCSRSAMSERATGRISDLTRASSVEEHSSSDQLNCGEVISGELVISGGTKLLELLDEVAFAVKRPSLDLAVGLGGITAVMSRAARAR